MRAGAATIEMRARGRPRSATCARHAINSKAWRLQRSSAEHFAAACGAANIRQPVPCLPGDSRTLGPLIKSRERGLIAAKSAASLRLETHAREMFEPPGRDQQAVDSGRVEHDAQGGGRHGLREFVG